MDHINSTRPRYLKNDRDPKVYGYICPGCSKRYGKPLKTGYIELQRCEGCPTMLEEFNRSKGLADPPRMEIDEKTLKPVKKKKVYKQKYPVTERLGAKAVKPKPHPLYKVSKKTPMERKEADYVKFCARKKEQLEKQQRKLEGKNMRLVDKDNPEELKAIQEALNAM